MILSAKKLCEEITKGNDCDPDGIAVVPGPEFAKIEQTGEASVELRLGRWFLTLRQSNDTHLDATLTDDFKENRFSKTFFVPFGEIFVLHPGRFALAGTLEWIRLPNKYAAYVVGKSTLGRRGIVIETAAGVHPGFSGCLTLEIANVGEVPVKLVSGMLICQLFFHSLEGELSSSRTRLAGQRRPRLGRLGEDLILTKLRKSKR